MSEPITLNSPVSRLRGVGDETGKRLQQLGVVSVRDLVELLPRRIEDRSQLRPIADLSVGEPQVISGEVERVSGRVSQRGTFIVTARVKDESGTINAAWFNQRFLLRTLKSGQTVTLFGEKRLAKTMGNPFFVKKIIDKPGIIPIYPLTAGLTQTVITKLLQSVRPLIKTIRDIIPETTRTQQQLPRRATCLEQTHFNPSEASLAVAQKLLGFEELLVTSLLALESKARRRDQLAAIQLIANDTANRFLEAFEFTLTDGQRQVIHEVLEDLTRSYPMNRLVYGEVGSGKTAIGLVAAASIAAQKKQVLWLSPTVTLAEQQARITAPYVKKFGQSVALLTSSTKAKTDDQSIIIGTHALLQRAREFGDVGLIVIDEQQRFGVEQRNLLLKRYPGAHLLMMTATPIPRTLAHTLFGHLDISYLLDKPRHQVPITTKVFRENSRRKVEEHISKRIAAGQPGYVICPLINDPENDATLFADERKAVQSEFHRLKGVFPQARLGLIHGQLRAAEKEEIMSQFRSGKIDILVATSVIEVGIDNPEATWIVIEEADRFGLSQLHQLRGRVGRGEHPSVCFLHNSLSTERASTRLSALVNARDGLEIAELDLALRGPGDIAGTEQSGLPNVRYADLGNLEAITAAYQAAEKIGVGQLAKYPELEEELNRWRKDERAPT